MNLKLVSHILGNTLVQSLGKVFSVGLSFISIALLTRYLGVSGYGNYTLIFSYLAFFSLIADFGFQVVAVKEIVSVKEKLEKIYGTYFLLRFGLVIFSTFLALIFLIFFPYSNTLKIGIFIGSLAVGVSGMTGYFNTVFQARVRLDLLTILDLVGRVGSVIGIIASVYLKLNFYYIIGSVLFGNTISFLLGMYLLPETVKTSFDYKFAKRLFLLSLPVGITSLLSTLYFKIDTIILSLYKPASDVGVYSLGYKILDNITLFWLFYVGTIYPILTKFRLENENKYRSLFKNSIILACIVSVPIVVISYFIAPLAINIFGGASFNDAIFALRILVFSLPFIFVNVLFYNFYIIEEFNIVVILGMLITLVINIVLNVVYIPRFSYIAASYITILSEVVLSVVYIIGVLYLKSRRNYEK